MIAFDKFLPVYFFSEPEKPVVTISVKWKSMHLTNPRISFCFGPVLNHVYTAAALLDRLPCIHSFSLFSCSRSCRNVSEVAVPIKCHLVMRLIMFRSFKLKTLMDFQMFWLLWSTWETEGQASFTAPKNTNSGFSTEMLLEL